MIDETKKRKKLNCWIHVKRRHKEGRKTFVGEPFSHWKLILAGLKKKKTALRLRVNVIRCPTTPWNGRWSREGAKQQFVGVSASLIDLKK